MSCEEIIIRPAEQVDIEQIWRVLHAEGCVWSIEKITKNINKLFVLIHRDLVLGILFGLTTPNGITVSWVKVHPMYSETSIKNTMVSALTSVIRRQHETI